MLLSKRLKHLDQIDDQVEKGATTTSTNTLSTDRVGDPIPFGSTEKSQNNKTRFVQYLVLYISEWHFASQNLQQLSTARKHELNVIQCSLAAVWKTEGLFSEKITTFSSLIPPDRFEGLSVSRPVILVILFRSSNIVTSS